ncbi:MAG TPA: exopolysaccharide biosynthesis protein [Longimicrobium sp.]|nr:exopolysaccharide biosynthesis protein [Longimicrobium sp.]
MNPAPLGRRAGTGELLGRAVSEMERRYETSGSANLGDVLGALGPRAGALSAALLALPLVSPMNLGPVTLAVSGVIALLGLGMLRQGEPRPLPPRLLAVPVPRAVFRVMRAMLSRLSRWIDRPQPARTAAWVRGAVGRRICGAGLVAGAALLAIPVPILPLTNTFPALAVVFFVLGWSNRDARMTALGMGALVLGAAVFAALGIAVATIGLPAIRAALPF